MMRAADEQKLSRTVSDESTATALDLPSLARRTMAERIADRPKDHAHGARYEIGKLLGSGGTGQVYAVRDRDCARDVALKVLHRSAPRDSQRRERFVLEAQVTAQLEHPGILPVYDIDVAEDGNVYFTMRKIDGMSLGECIRLAQAGATPAAIALVNDRVGIVLRVCEAVAFAHHRGVIHQDIKPDNIMLGAFG
ncbi:MAG: serine/threonine protein kinase, partial [Planctomycetes bacterium]|nr:serine/threonine protein kinase [Planctomycetota bacterium]